MMDTIYSPNNGGNYEIVLDRDSKVPLLEQQEKSESLHKQHIFLRLRWVLLAMTAIFGLFGIAYFSHPKSYLKRDQSWKVVIPKNVSLPNTYDGVQTHNPVNSTLGFQRVFALNLPHRIDEKDELSLMGYASDIKVDFISTRLTKDLQDSGLPFHIRFDHPGVIGCWRAHSDAWKKIVSERVTSALIVEDDVDWDADIK